MVLGLLGIDFEMMKDERVEVAAEQVVSLNWLRLLRLRDSEV